MRWRSLAEKWLEWIQLILFPVVVILSIGNVKSVSFVKMYPLRSFQKVLLWPNSLYMTSPTTLQYLALIVYSWNHYSLGGQSSIVYLLYKLYTVSNIMKTLTANRSHRRKLTSWVFAPKVTYSMLVPCKTLFTSPSALNFLRDQLSRTFQLN